MPGRQPHTDARDAWPFGPNAVRKLARGARELAWELVGLGGAGAITYGAWLILEPAGWIAGGGLVLAAFVSRGLAQARASARNGGG